METQPDGCGVAGRWDAYTKAKEAMLFYTDTADAPWTIVRSDDKSRARLNAIRHVLYTIPYSGKDNDVVTSPDSRIVGSAKSIYEHGENSHSQGGRSINPPLLGEYNQLQVTTHKAK